MMIALSAQDEAAIWRSVECHIWHIRVETITTTKKLSKSETDHKNQRHDPKRQLLLVLLLLILLFMVPFKDQLRFRMLATHHECGGELCKDIET